MNDANERISTVDREADLCDSCKSKLALLIK